MNRILFLALGALALLSGFSVEMAPWERDLVEQKRMQYRRNLMPPQEAELDVSGWLDYLASPERTRDDFFAFEDILDARSRIYSLADRLRHRPVPDPTDTMAISRAYAALFARDVTAAHRSIEDLSERAKSAECWMPLTLYSPFSWVKCFTQWGYVRSPEGCGVFEPMPWNLVWQDGFRCNLAQDRRVAIANTAGEPFFYETRFLEPVTDVRFMRDWTSTRWCFPDGMAVTFSLLTPIIDVDGTDELTIGGLPSEPDRIGFTDGNGLTHYLPLTEAVKIEPEVIASALVDFTAKPTPPPPPSRGVQYFDPASVERPWLRLASKAGNWSLLLLPGAKPVSASWQGGIFRLKLSRKSYVGVVRESLNLHQYEQPALAEFFAGVATAYPVRCTETVKGKRTTWRYEYRKRPNDWGLSPRCLAPVPPLADFAGASVDGLRRAKYPTKWNLLAYVEGESATATLPERIRREPEDLQGVNLALGESVDELWSNGVRHVRLFIGGGNLMANLRQLESRLIDFETKGIRALVDAHGAEYQVCWGSGASAAPADEARFVSLWDEISRIGARHDRAVDGYDLYNEPGLVAGSEERWRQLNMKVTRIIRSNHSGAKVCFSAVYGGNANGLFNLTPLAADCEPQVVTFHFYASHAFTHQKSQTQNRGGDTCVFYPSWTPVIDWDKGNHWGGTTVDWFDRWTLAAVMLPAFELQAQYGIPVHVGEFSVIGYANAHSPLAVFDWTRDSVEIFRHAGMSWHLWNGGFGLGNAEVRAYVFNVLKRAGQ